ncbi:MAG: DUF169 domain-containing protein [Caldisericia bacterium]|nr:DUF169 domain-containing protein [Caldisericia bacterium]MDD4614026.1 DUF169 domain-containing protein [Caldisericia bacterium]
MLHFTDISNDFKTILKLDTEPIGVRFLTSKKEAKSGMVSKKLNFCQLVANARYQNRTSTGVPEKMVCSLGASALGLMKTPQCFQNGSAAAGKYTKNAEAGRVFFENTYKLGDIAKQFEAVEVGPLGAIQPIDVFVIYANPAQMLGLIHANSYLDGRKTAGDTVAEGALCSATAYAKGMNQPIVGFPCAGDRRFASTQHSELVFAAPIDDLQRIHTSLIELRRLGPIYPIPPQSDFESLMPMAYTIKEADLL